MARKFSLKDNPIFQRLEIPKPPSADLPTHDEILLEERDKTNEASLHTNGEDTNERAEYRPSNIDPQNLPRTQNPSLLPQDRSTSVNKREEDEGRFIIEDRVDLKDSSQEDKEVSVIAQENEGQNLTLKKYTSQNISRDETEQIDPLSQTASKIPRDDSLHESIETSKHDEFAVRSSSDIEDDKERNQRSDFEAQNLTLKKGTSYTFNTEGRPVTFSSSLPSVQTLSDDSLLQDLMDSIDKSLFFSFYNEMNDDLLPQLDSAEQILYSRLFRLSYGFNRNYCTVSQPVLQIKTGLSRNTVRTGLQMLVHKEWVRIVGSGNHVSTTYRIVLPREKGGAKIDPQKLSLKNRPSTKDPHNLRRNSRSSKVAPPEAQKNDLQNLTPKTKKGKLRNEIQELSKRGANSEAHKTAPVTITDNILTLTQKESGNSAIDNSDHSRSANLLVTLFYAKLGQEPSSAKRTRGIGECIQLLRDGFSTDQIEYGINWLLSRHPGTGAFSRVAHFIDQALKEKETELPESLVQQKRRVSEEEERLAEKRISEEARQIEEIKASLAAETLAALREEAVQLVDSEHGAPKFGRETLVQIKVNELIRVRFLNTGGE